MNIFHLLLLFLLILQLYSLKLSHKSIIIQSYSKNNSYLTLSLGASISFQLTDNYFSYGIFMSNSWNMFIEWINYEKGGILINNQKYFLQLNYIEDYSNSIYVKEICQDFINSNNTLFLFGPYSSSLNSACASVTEPNKMFIFSGGSSDTTLFRNSDYLFGTLPGGIRYISATFELLDQLGAQTIAILRDSNYPSCDDSTISGAKLTSNITVFNVYDLNVNSPLYKEELLLILAQLKSNGIETIYGCSYSTMCLEVHIYLFYSFYYSILLFYLIFLYFKLATITC